MVLVVVRYSRPFAILSICPFVDNAFMVDIDLVIDQHNGLLTILDSCYLYLPLQGIFFKAFSCCSISSFDDSMSNMKKCLGTTPISRRRRSIDWDREGHQPFSTKKTRKMNITHFTLQAHKYYTIFEQILNSISW